MTKYKCEKCSTQACLFEDQTNIVIPTQCVRDVDNADWKKEILGFIKATPTAVLSAITPGKIYEVTKTDPDNNYYWINDDNDVNDSWYLGDDFIFAKTREELEDKGPIGFLKATPTNCLTGITPGKIYEVTGKDDDDLYWMINDKNENASWYLGQEFIFAKTREELEKKEDPVKTVTLHSLVLGINNFLESAGFQERVREG